MAIRGARWMFTMALLAAISACRGSEGDQPPAAAMSDSEPPPSAGSAADTSLPPPDSLRDLLVQHGLRIPTGERAEVIARLGSPDSTNARATPNRHVPATTDTIAELFYPGLRLEYRIAGPGSSSEFLDVADVEDNRYLAYPALGVGASAEEISSALGAPSERTDSTSIYDCRSCMGADSPVVFHFDDGHVSRVSYDFYVD